jgi:hypothetical protein
MTVAYPIAILGTFAGLFFTLMIWVGALLIRPDKIHKKKPS